MGSWNLQVILGLLGFRLENRELGVFREFARGLLFLPTSICGYPGCFLHTAFDQLGRWCGAFFNVLLFHSVGDRLTLTSHVECLLQSRRSVLLKHCFVAASWADQLRVRIFFAADCSQHPWAVSGVGKPCPLRASLTKFPMWNSEHPSSRV